jgi:hypothetical protein
MVEILALVLQHDEQAVLTAVELALEAGAKTHILNVLHRLIDGKPIDPSAVNPPNALTLTEPQSNAERYDALRESGQNRANFPALEVTWGPTTRYLLGKRPRLPGQAHSLRASATTDRKCCHSPRSEAECRRRQPPGSGQIAGS